MMAERGMAGERVTAVGSTVCGKCEEADGLTVFAEHRRAVVGSRGVLRFLAAVVLTVIGIEVLFLGSGTSALVLFALVLPAAVGCAVAVRRARTEEATVLLCPHCLTRTEV
ncbi:hypothetical protein ACIA8O_02425 [Kitasatospora sp. NPDC051853]|uniref:hypothetical protein n=1 Tax=Kitasatospora sp. NPDC051853 TaxID=3364058 RepID=UPI0037B9E7F8